MRNGEENWEGKNGKRGKWKKGKTAE